MIEKESDKNIIDDELPEAEIQEEDTWTEIPEPLVFPERSWKVTLSHGYGQESIRISLALIVFMVVFLLFWLGLTLFLLFGNNSSNQSSEIHRLKQENQRLHERLKHYEAVVDSISARIDILRDDSLPLFGNAGGEYPFVPASASSKKKRTAKEPSLTFRFHALDLKLQKLMLALGDSVIIPSQISERSFPEHQNGDGIPSIYPTFGVISSGFGMRIHPIYNELMFHEGLDIANEIGTPIYATADGVVRSISYDSGYGKRMYITHSDGYETQYAHLYSYQVQENDVVKKGQIIALMGDSGISTGPHLHYEVILNGQTTDPVAYLNRIDTTRFAGR